MKRSVGLATLALALGLGIATAPQVATAAEQAAEAVTATTEQAAEAVSGKVVKVEVERSRVTVLGSDGQIYEFEASEETLKDLKVGDHIEAKRRPATN